MKFIRSNNSFIFLVKLSLKVKILFHDLFVCLFIIVIKVAIIRIITISIIIITIIMHYLAAAIRCCDCGAVRRLFLLASIFVKISSTPLSSQGTATVVTVLFFRVVSQP